MKHAKKIAGIALSMAFLVSTLGGCGSSTSQQPGSSSTTSSESSTAQSGKTIKLVITQWGEPNKDKNLDQNYQFGVSNPGYELETMVIPEGEYSSKLNQMIAAGNAPDIVTAWECDLQGFAASKKIVALDDYIAKSSKVKADDFIPAVAKLKELNGATYGLPWCYAAEIMYYNKDMFDAAKVTYPTNEWTMSDFVAAAEKLTKIENGKVVQYGADGMGFVGGWWSGIGAAGDEIYKDGKLSIGEGAKKFLQTQKDLVDKQIIPAPSADSAGSDLFASGRAAMSRTGSWMVGTYKDLEFNWDIAPQPKDAKAYNTLHTGMYSIPETTKDKDAAWKAIEWLMSDGQPILSKGTGNMSAIKSIAAKGDYKVQGKKGPSNWTTYDVAAQSGQFGYVLLPAGITGDAVKAFEAAVLGQKSIDDTVKEVMEKASK
ncbi:MAG: extracellular solute-binding protein family 1 [Eubacterium sp.]|jgi:multiple sugar transport system substrate-binding protein|nr:extracellular solute-binding protein family 1 [Eubacterium sp.]